MLCIRRYMSAFLPKKIPFKKKDRKNTHFLKMLYEPPLPEIMQNGPPKRAVLINR